MRPGDRQPLALAAGEPHAALPHQRVVALWQRVDEAVRLGALGGGAELRVGGGRAAVREVVGTVPSNRNASWPT